MVTATPGSQTASVGGSTLTATVTGLTNGNTLITEGLPGRMFQVTPEGEVVWEHVCPCFGPGLDGALVNSVSRATHYLPDEVPALR